jgi:microcompartment protein CcmK/EutM
VWRSGRTEAFGRPSRGARCTPSTPTARGSPHPVRPPPDQWRRRPRPVSREGRLDPGPVGGFMGESAELETVSEGRELDHRGAAVDFARRVRERYGDVVETVLLYGSVARNEARGRDSDVDLLVVLVDDVDRTEFERRRTRTRRGPLARPDVRVGLPIRGPVPRTRPSRRRAAVWLTSRPRTCWPN